MSTLSEQSSAPPPISSAPPPASSAPPLISSAAAPSTNTLPDLTAIEIATSIVVVTPSASRNGETATPIIVTSVVTREGSAIVAITVDAQPSSCSSRWLLYTTSAGSATIVTSGNYAETIRGQTLPTGYWRDCYPNAPKGTNIPNYSPAICSGHQSLNTMRSAVTGSLTVWTGICCPTGMEYFAGCQGTFTGSFTALSLSSTASNLATPVSAYFSPTVLSTGTMFAEPVTVLWQSSDLTSFPTAFATALAASMGIEYGMRSGVPKQTDAQPSLTTGAKVGAALGGVLGFAMLVGAMIMLCLRRRRRAQRTRGPDMPEMSGNSSGLRSILHGKWRAEVDGASQPVEIDSNARIKVVPPVELEAPHRERAKSPGREQRGT